jgi:uncharacterized protein (DUF58 family)
VQLHWTWKEPARVECSGVAATGRLQEQVTARRRFCVQEVRRRFAVVDALGLARVAWGRAEPATLSALPAPGALRRAQLAASLSSGDGSAHPAGSPEGDRLEIRPYVPGDSPRHILWKSFARSRRLDVRMPERAVALAERVVAYLAVGADDEAAAAAARVALESGALGADWVFGADGTDGPARSLPAALLAVARSGNAAPRPGALAGFVRRFAGPGSSCVIFAPAAPGPWAGEVARALRERAVPIWLVLGCEGPVVDRVPRPALWRRALIADAGSAAVSRAEIAGLIAGLPGLAGAWVAERGTGRVQGIGALRRAPGAAA